MTNQVAVLSDIHGALPALEAVLAEPDVRAADYLMVTGDITAGPLPIETLDLLVDLGDRVLWVSGNADREMVEYRRGVTSGIEHPESQWAADQLRDDQVAFLESLPASVELEIAGLGRTLFCHATPRSDDEVVLVDSRLDRWTEVFSTLADDIDTVVCGHTHMPFVRLAHGRVVVNPGSVGMPYGRSGAHWALLGPGVALRRTVFDVDAAIARVTSLSGFPDAAEWADFYLRARASDAEALGVFGPRDGRP